MQKDCSSGPGKVKRKAVLKRSPQMNKARKKMVTEIFVTILFYITNEVLGIT